MTFVAFLPLLISLGLYCVPVWLLRRHGGAGSRTFIAGRTASPAALRNASIAHALRVALFAPFVVLGAEGDLWPVIIAAAGLGAGIGLLYVLRQPIFAFLADALADPQSITLHAFIARAHGGDHRVRVAAALLTLFTLAVLIAAEAFALSGFLKIVAGNNIVAHVLTLAALGLAGLYAWPAGQAGTTHAAQWQLAMLFIGLFGAAALLVYLHVSTLTPLPPQGLFAISFFFVFSIGLMVYRHSRYLDTILVAETPAAKWLSLLGKILNPAISVLVVLVAVLALMEFIAAGFSTVAGGVVAALQADTSLPVVALCALALVPLLQPLVDVANWQRLATLEANRKSFRGNEARWRAALHGFFRLYAVESGLLWLLMACLGAIAVAATGIAANADVIPSLLRALASADNEIGIAAFALLLVAVFALALAAMSAAFSAALCSVGQDIQPATEEAGSSIRPRLFIVAVLVALGLADAILRIDVSGSDFIALLVALGAPQLALVPLVLGPLMTGRGVSPDWALGILGAGAASATAAVGCFALTGNVAWLWAAAPAGLAAGSLAYAAALFSQGRRMR